MKKLILFCLPVPYFFLFVREQASFLTTPLNQATVETVAAPENGNILLGGFFDEKGNYLGYDGKGDGKIYVLKTTQTSFTNESEGNAPVDNITEWDRNKTINYIRRFSGQSFAFNNNTAVNVYNNFQELVGSRDIRLIIYSIVSLDGQTGVDDSANFREYGGRVDYYKGGRYQVNVAKPGLAQNPSTKEIASIYIDILSNTVIEFHSHPSGETSTHRFKQAPSAIDIGAVNSRTGYVFGMQNNTVYIYNEKGIAATFPLKSFVDPFKR